MTEAEAIQKIQVASQGALTEDDIKGLQGCTPNQLGAILKMYADLGGPPASKSFWIMVLDTIRQVPLSTWVQLAKDLAKVLGPLVLA
jgi:hypothetical protein